MKENRYDNKKQLKKKVTPTRNGKDHIFPEDKIVQAATDKYFTLFNNLEHGFCIIKVIFDEEGNPVDYHFLEINAVFERQTGLKDVIGKNMRSLQPHHEEHWFSIYGDVVKTGESVHFENYAAHLAGGVWYEVFAFRFGPAENHEVAVLFNDITKRKRYEQQQGYLLKLSDTLRSLADPVVIEETVTQMAMNYFEADRCYYCTIEGENAVIRSDASREDLPSVSGIYRLNSFPIFKKIVEEGVPFVFNNAIKSDILDEELRQLCIRFQVISAINIPVIKNEKAVGVFCLVQSTPRQWKETEIELMTETAERIWTAVERARTEETLKELSRSLEQKVIQRTAELASSKELLQNMNRELRSLNEELKTFTSIAINDYGQTLRQLYIHLETIVNGDARNLSGSGRANLRRAQSAVQKMKLLTEDIVSFSRLQQIAIKEDNAQIDVILKNVLQEFDKQPGLPSFYIHCDDMPVVSGYPFLLSLMFQHLLENAIKFRKGDTGHTIHITCSESISSSGISHPDVQEEKSYHVISIIDNGIGFPANEAEKIFGMFYRLHDKKSYKGSGIGLAIAKKIMEMHGGFITAESEPGNGASFHCYFPA